MLLVKEEPDVALWFGCPRQGLSKGLPGLRSTPPRVLYEGGQQADLDRTSGPSRRLGGCQQAVQQARCLDERSAVLVPVLREDQTYEREVVELAQIAGVIRDGHASVPGPVSGLRKLALRDPDPGLHGGNGSHVREESRSVQLLRLIQVADGRIQVALGLGEESSRHEPAVATLVHPGTVSGCCGGLEVSPGALEVSGFDVDLAQPHVQVGDRARQSLALCLGSSAVPARTAGVPCSAGRPPSTGQRARPCCSTRRRGCRPRAGWPPPARTSPTRSTRRPGPRRRGRGTRPLRPARDDRQDRPGPGHVGRVPP